MTTRLNLVGKTFGRWTVQKEVRRTKYGEYYWECQCTCGTVRNVRGSKLKAGTSQSCGCLQRERASTANLKHGHTKTKPEQKNRTSRTYTSWQDMKNRCTNPKCTHYERYGGRGITYDPTWEDFENFLADMGECPPGLTLERIDSDGNYCKTNCKWVTRKVQSNNTSRNRFLTLNGKTQTVAQWADELNINPGTISSRLRTGWTVAEALTIPPGQRKKEAASLRLEEAA